jgi:hypothetical protein
MENDGKRANRSTVLGTLYLDAIPEPLREFYSTSFAEVLKTGNVWEHDFECSAPQTNRLFHMRMLRLSHSHLLIENSLRVEHPHVRKSPPQSELVTYVNEHGILTMCCHCRRTRRIAPDQNAVWDWIPRFLMDQPARISHGLCQTCMGYFYPETGNRPSASSR